MVAPKCRYARQSLLSSAKAELAKPPCARECYVTQSQFRKRREVLCNSRRETIAIRMCTSLLWGEVRGESHFDYGISVDKTILRGTHRFVVGAERALYLLVVDAGQSAKANRLDYWLRFLAHYGSLEVSGQMSRAPVIVVRTKCDKVSHNIADRTSAENATYVGRDASDLTAALEIARENEWYGANVVEVIDDVGYPQSEYDVAGTTCQDAESAERLRNAICEHTENIIGINNPCPCICFEDSSLDQGEF